MTKKLLFEIEVDELQGESQITASDIFSILTKNFPLSLVGVEYKSEESIFMTQKQHTVGCNINQMFGDHKHCECWCHRKENGQ